MKFPKPSAIDYGRSKKDATRPPVFRDADFAMRFEQGRWSEERLIESINKTPGFRALPYGRSQVGPEDAGKIKEYWKDYVAAETNGKRPDILIVREQDYKWARAIAGADPTVASEKTLAPVLERAVCGIEAENSLWVSRKMKDFDTKVPLSKKEPQSPNIWVKDQDAPGPRVWMYHYQKPVLVIQVFYDAAYAMPLHDLLALADRVEAEPDKDRALLQKKIGLFVKVQSYADARTGAATKKKVFVAHHSISTLFGELVGEVTPVPKVIFSKNGKVMPCVAFTGGRLQITSAGQDLLQALADA